MVNLLVEIQKLNFFIGFQNFIWKKYTRVVGVGNVQNLMVFYDFLKLSSYLFTRAITLGKEKNKRMVKNITKMD